MVDDSQSSWSEFAEKIKQLIESLTSRILLVTVSPVLYPITTDILYQVFSPHGVVEKIIPLQQSINVQALIHYQERHEAISARSSLQHRYIYDGCCQMDIQFENDNTSTSYVEPTQIPDSFTTVKEVDSGEGQLSDQSGQESDESSAIADFAESKIQVLTIVASTAGLVETEPKPLWTGSNGVSVFDRMIMKIDGIQKEEVIGVEVENSTTIIFSTHEVSDVVELSDSASDVMEQSKAILPNFERIDESKIGEATLLTIKDVIQVDKASIDSSTDTTCYYMGSLITNEVILFVCLNKRVMNVGSSMITGASNETEDKQLRELELSCPRRFMNTNMFVELDDPYRFRLLLMGVREHNLTGFVSSLARFMFAQETSFVTLGHRVLATSLLVALSSKIDKFFWHNLYLKISLIDPGLEWDASFFDEPVMLLGFVALGRFLEEKARIKASSDMNELLSLISTQSRLVITSSNTDSSVDSVLSSDAICIEVPSDDIRFGDSMLVSPGEIIPIDGKLFAGRSEADESILTGESLLVFKEKGLMVLAETINWDGPLRIEATSTGSNSTISKIVRMVEDARGQEAPVQRLEDAIAGLFVYSIMTLSAATFAFWYYAGLHISLDVLLNDIVGPDGDPLLLSSELTVDVLVISCPRALGLATPTVILVGTSFGARQGLLIRGANVLERLTNVDHVAFEKIGTLTEGKPTISLVVFFTYNESEILRIVAAVERTETHPIAKAIVKRTKLLNLTLPETRRQLVEPDFRTLAKILGSDLSHYRVEINPEIASRKLDKAIMIELVKLYINSDLGMNLPVYDGRKNLYTAGSLLFTSKVFTVILVEEDEETGNVRNIDFEVTIKFVAIDSMVQLCNLLSRKQVDNPQGVLNVINAELRELEAQRYLSVGRFLYSPNIKKPLVLGDGVESGRGFFQSISPTQMGLSLNIDMSTIAFIGPLPVIDFVAQILGKDVYSKPMSDADRVKVKKALRGVKVEVTHRRNVRRKYQISGLTTQPTRKLIFPLDEHMNMKSVVEYFQEVDGYTIRYAHLPCLQVGNEKKVNYLTMETCKILEVQRYTTRLNEKRIYCLLKVSCQRSHEQEMDILQTLQQNDYDHDPYAKEFGSNISSKRVSIEGWVVWLLVILNVLKRAFRNIWFNHLKKKKSSLIKDQNSKTLILEDKDLFEGRSIVRVKIKEVKLCRFRVF